MPRPLFLLPLLSAPLLCHSAQVLAAPAQPAAASSATAKLTYLDDDAEAGGFDITATLKALPVTWSLCQDAEGQAYRLRLDGGSATLSLKTKSGEKELASTRLMMSPGALVVQRRGAMWRVLLNGKRLLEADDATLSAGKVGYVGSVGEARLQPVEEIAFDDDFMRVKEDVAYQAAKGDPHSGMRISDIKDNETIWKSVAGTWATTGLSENAEAQVAQSVNAFVFKTTSAGDNIALAGRPFWNDYSLEASVRPEGSSIIGLVFYAQDAKNYLALKWEARQGMDENSGRILLQSVVDGKETTLAQSAGGFEDKQWYRMKVAVEGDLVRASVDDNEVVRARTTLFGRGQAGLWARNTDKAITIFDDVRVRSNHDIEDDFSRRIPGRWQAQGEWNWNGAAQAIGTSASRALIGESGWHDYSVAAPLALPADGNAGLLLNESADGAYLVRVGGSKSHAGFAGKAQILKLSGGKVQVLASTPTGSTLDGKAVTLGASAGDGYISATLDGTRVADAFDESLKSGRAGLWSWRATSAPTFGAFAVRFPDVRPTWAKVPELYNDARQAETMGGWSTPEGFWLPTNPMAGSNAAVLTTQVASKPADASKPPTTMWHKGTFWGDGGMKFKVPELNASQSFVILLDGPSSKAGNEMQLVFMVKDGSLQCSLTQGAQATPVASGSVKIEGKASDYNVDIRQRGSFIIVRAAKGDAARTTLFAARVK